MIPSSSSCGQNCANCLYQMGNYVCTLCISGSIPINGQCVSCQLGCSICSPNNPTICSVCSFGFGFTLAQSNYCTVCPSNCITCSNGYCFNCANGFTLTSQLTCVPMCQYPCSSCNPNNPYSCLSCVAGYVFNIAAPYNCQIDLSCSSTASCLTCPAGYSVLIQSLTNQVCLQCNSSNCFRCNSQNITQCTSCNFGWYLNTLGNNCSPCPSPCSTCINSFICLSCKYGYVALNNPYIINNNV